MTAEKKAFDCIELQDRAAERIYEQIKDMTIDEQIAFWEERAQALRARREAARQERAPA